MKNVPYVKITHTYQYEVRHTINGDLIGLADEPSTARRLAERSLGIVEIIDNDGRYRYAARFIDGKIQTISPDFKKATAK